jgi:hypothetical protein
LLAVVLCVSLLTIPALAAYDGEFQYIITADDPSKLGAVSFNYNGMDDSGIDFGIVDWNDQLAVASGAVMKELTAVDINGTSIPVASLPTDWQYGWEIDGIEGSIGSVALMYNDYGGGGELRILFSCITATQDVTITFIFDAGSGAPAAYDATAAVASGQSEWGTATATETADGSGVWDLAAMPNTGYQFECWKVDSAIVSTSAEYQVTPTANTTYTAYFVEETAPPPATGYTVSLATADSGKKPGETIILSLNVSAAESEEFAALETVVTYNDALVSYAGTSLSSDHDYTVADNESGKLTVTHFGDSTDVGTLGTLSFTVKNGVTDSDTAVFGLEYALVGVGAPVNTDDPPAASIGGNVSVTLAAGSSEPGVIDESDISFIGSTDYKGAPTGFKVLKLTATAPEDNKYQYEGADMLFSSKYNAYVCFVPDAVTAATALPKLTYVSGTAPTVNYNGNVNQSTGTAYGVVNIYDAQLVYDLYSGAYVSDTTFTTVSAAMRFAADMNGDGKVNIDDAQAIIDIILGKDNT